MTKSQSQDRQPSRPRTMKRSIRRRDAMDAAQRFQTQPNGSVVIVRFTLGQRIEHMVLILSFTGLAITGLAQTYYDTALGDFILALFGGLASMRSIHHLFAFVFGIQSVYHLASFVYERFVFMRPSRMMPNLTDAGDFFNVLALNLGLSKKHPRFDRYNFEEKAVYWIVVLGAGIMGISGLMQWFPIQVTEFLPGWVIPVARTIHRLQAILTVLMILVWHTYQTIIRTRNTSIFTGLISLEQMQEDHPLELLYLEAAAASIDNQKWPLLLKIPMEEQQTINEEAIVSPGANAEIRPEEQSDDKKLEKNISLEKEIETINGD